MKKFKINYLIRYFENTEDFTHSLRSVTVIYSDKLQVQEDAFSLVTATTSYCSTNIKSIEIGEIEEVTNEG